MFSKSTITALTLAILSIAAPVAAQSPPPACVLACVNEFDSPADFTAICKTDVADMVSCLDRACAESNQKTAVEHYKSACEEAAGIEVVMPKVTSTSAGASSTGTPTGTSRVTSTSEAEDKEEGGNGTDKDADTDVEDNEGAASLVGVNSLLALVGVFVAAVAL